MDEDPLITEDIVSCLMCNTTFETHEERFVHTCAQIKTERNELDNDKQTNSYDQENFKSDMNSDFLEHNLIYGLERKKQKKSNMIESEDVSSEDVSSEDSDYSPIEKQVKRNTIVKPVQKRKRCEITDQEEEQKNKKPRVVEEKWLTAYKSQCKVGEHKQIEMAKLIGMNTDTFRSKIAREKKSKVIKIAYNGPLTCHFCLKIQSQEAEDRESDPFVTPKRNASIKKNKKPRVEEEEWLTAYKSQCKLGEHNNIEMAKLIGMNVDTFRGKIARERKRNGVIEIAYNGPLNCQFCLKIQSLEPEDRESIPTPKRKNGLITEEIMAKVATSCSKHTRLDMANFFGIKRNALNQRINRSNLVFSNTEEDPLICFFCQKIPSINSPTIYLPSSKIITEEMMNITKTKCADNHNLTEVAKELGVKTSTLRYHMNKLEKSEYISFQPIVDPKKETDELDFEDQFDLCDNYDLDLTEEFLTLILKQVDDLCENIQNGDPNMDRTLEVKQNLNNAVHCYRTYYEKNRNKNSVDNLYVIKAEGQEYYDHTDVNLDLDYKEIQYDSQNEEKSRLAQKRKEPVLIPAWKRSARKANVDKKFELVKNQCGKHGLKSMSLMLHMHKTTLERRIKFDGIVFKEKKIDDCYFCEMKKNNENISKDMLYQFMIYDKDKDNFKCSICQFSKKYRGDMFTHIRSIHKNEINASTNSKIVEKNDCGNTSCKKLYGILDNKKYWCRKCIELSQMPKPDFLQPARKNVKNKSKLCPECGKSVTLLKRHLRDVHGEKQKCPHCDLLTVRLKDHIYQVHEKKPCPDCGKLFTDFRMKMHIMSKHTPDDQKKFKCEFCVKGFAMKIQLTDHRHIHTGEKPYKCKFCSACFASKGNHLAHQKSHLGYRRNYAKK